VVEGGCLVVEGIGEHLGLLLLLRRWEGRRVELPGSHMLEAQLQKKKC
jgi:hypothetical protein